MLLDLLFPRKCLGCGEVGGYFCADCLNLIQLVENEICPTCGRFSSGGLNHRGCKGKELDGLTSVFKYEGLVKKAIKRLKYQFLTDLAEDLVELFLSFCGENKAFVKYCHNNQPILLPIPLHFSRKRWRGFNQSELLGKIISRNLGLGFEANLLLRAKNTRPQADLDKKDRRKNIRGAFEINPGNKATSSFLLFDDVWTSGATLKEAAGILKKAGAKEIWGLTLAR